MLTYLNLTLTELEEYFDYDREAGDLYLRRSGKKVTSNNATGLVASVRVDCKVIKLSVGKLCYFMEHKMTLANSDKIIYVDGDYTNLKPDNLRLVSYVAPEEESYRRPIVDLGGNIFYNETEGYYFLRRSPKQSVYRAYDLKEVISVRNEWEMDKKIHKWDSFSTVCEYV